MKNDTKSKLDAILVARGQRLSAKERQASERLDRENRSLTQFKELRTSMLRPAMEEIAASLRGNDIFASIEDVNETPATRLHPGSSDVQINFSIRDAALPESAAVQPTLRISFNKSDGRITATELNVGVMAIRSTPQRAILLADLTRDQVEEWLVEFVGHALQEPRIPR